MRRRTGSMATMRCPQKREGNRGDVARHWRNVERAFSGKAFHDGENGVSERRTRLAGIRAMLPTERTKEGNEETGGGRLKSRGDERLEEGIHAGTIHGGKGEIKLAQLAPFPPTRGVDPLGGRFPREVNRRVAVHQHVRNHGSLDETPFSKVRDFPPKAIGWWILPPSAPVRH